MVLPAILLYELANTAPICCRFFCRIFCVLHHRFYPINTEPIWNCFSLLFWPWQYRAFMLPFFLLYFPWTLRQCSDCCIVLLYCPGQNGRVLFGVFAGVFAGVLAGTTEVSHDLAGVLLLLYWNTTRLYLYFEIKTWGHSPRVLLASKTRHPPRVLCSCGNPTPNTCGCDEQRERREGEHTQAQWHGAIWTWIIEGEYRFCCFAVFLGVFLVKSPLFWLENRQKICCCIVSVLSQITAVFSANTAGFTAE